MQPLLTVIIPVFNGTDFLPGCVDSLKMQQFNGVEFLFVNDGSTDNSLQLIEDFFQSGLGIVRVHNQPNSGAYAAMNTGIRLARGNWLLFLGCDDRLMDKNVLGDVANAILSYDKPDLLYGNVRLLSNNEVYGGLSSVHDLLWKQNICHQAMFYHRSVFEKIGLFNTDYRIWADWEFNIRLFRCTNLRTQYVDREIAVYNDTSGISFKEDPLFRKELPVFIRRDMEQQIWQLQQSQAYRWGTALFSLKEKVRRLIPGKK